MQHIAPGIARQPLAETNLRASLPIVCKYWTVMRNWYIPEREYAMLSSQIARPSELTGWINNSNYACRNVLGASVKPLTKLTNAKHNRFVSTCPILVRKPNHLLTLPFWLTTTPSSPICANNNLTHCVSLPASINAVTTSINTHLAWQRPPLIDFKPWVVDLYLP